MPRPRSSASCAISTTVTGMPGVGEVHRDAAAHRAGADHRRLLDLLGRRVRRDVRDLGRLALGEEEVALGLRLRRVEELDEELALARDALGERQIHRGLDRLDAVLRRAEAPRLARHALAELGEELRLAPRRRDLVVEVADLLERPLLGERLLGERDAGRREVTVHDLVDQPDLERLVGADRIAAHDHLERLLRTRRRAAVAACRRRPAGCPSFTSGRPKRARLRADAVVAGERDLEAAAERGAVDRGHDRLRRALDHVEHRVQAGLHRRLAELGDVGAGDERAPGADDDDRLDGALRDRLRDPVVQALAYVLAQRVDRRVVDGEHGHAAAGAQVYGLGDLRHVRLL